MLSIVLLSAVTTLCYLLDTVLIISLSVYKYPIFERQTSGCEWEKYEPSNGTKTSKKLR